MGEIAERGLYRFDICCNVWNSISLDGLNIPNKFYTPDFFHKNKDTFVRKVTLRIK